MKEIFIIKDCFDDSETILKFLKNKNCNVNLTSNEELSNLEKNKSTIICSQNFQESIGGKTEILKISRKVGSTNIIILNNSDKKYSVLAILVVPI